MEKKETAVEWLIDKLNTISWTLYCPKEVLDKLIAEAKEMEKEQIIDAYWDGGHDVPLGIETCVKYYNDTFNKTENNEQK